MIKLYKYWLPFLCWALLIYWFSSLPTVTTTQVFWQDFIFKKSAHFFEFMMFSLLLFRALKNSGVEIKKAFVLTFFISLLYAVSDEFHQSFVPGREPRVRDVIIDALGAVSILFVLTKFSDKMPQIVTNLAKKIEVI